jgi:hypothetical protein
MRATSTQTITRREKDDELFADPHMKPRPDPDDIRSWPFLITYENRLSKNLPLPSFDDVPKDEQPFLGTFGRERTFPFSMGEARWLAIKLFGFFLPFRETIEALLPHGPFLEVGAGCGTLSAALRAAGADVVATDADGTAILPNGHGYAFQTGRRIEVIPMDGAQAVAAHPGRLVLLSCPTYDDPWSERVLDAIPIGGRILYVGEGMGGCTATDAFHEDLMRDFESEACIPTMTWPSLHDRAEIFVRTKAAGKSSRRRRRTQSA